MNNQFYKWPLLLALLVTLSFSSLHAADDDDVDYLELAVLMLRDGNIDRALNALQQVDTSVEEFDWAKYHRLHGMAYLRSGNKELAKESLEKAIDAGANEAVVFVYLAQVSFDLGDYQAAIDALNRAQADVERIASTYHMRAQAHWLLKQYPDALAVLD